MMHLDHLIGLRPRRRPAALATATAVTAVVLAAALGAASAAAKSPTTTAAQRAVVAQVATRAFARYPLRALIVRVTKNGRNVYTKAFGTSMTGVPATPAMHFRNGAFAFTYEATAMMRLVDQGRVALDDTISKWLPGLRNARNVTVQELLNMTSGYADYVYQPVVVNGTTADPFRQWTPNELVRIGVSRPYQFAPGTNWGYSHTNYAINGKLLPKITGMPLAKALKRLVLGPMGLTHTLASTTPTIPEPVLHAYSSERREYFGIKPGLPFIEDSTYWNPSWTTDEGAVETTTIADVARSMYDVAHGTILSPSSHAAQIAPALIGFGHSQSGCAVCARNTVEHNYGFGETNMGQWVTQMKNFAGSTATGAASPSNGYAIAVVTTYKPSWFDPKIGAYQDASATEEERGLGVDDFRSRPIVC